VPGKEGLVGKKGGGEGSHKVTSIPRQREGYPRVGKEVNFKGEREGNGAKSLIFRHFSF